ncbi:hypothetical protein, partial [Kitasatospora sp. NPDC007106]|uniref:hypothetical protein n=1 Tax=Kitasatospora sp. NPDC007106 TaxID=3156914 RepID=UPI0033C219BA
MTFTGVPGDGTAGFVKPAADAAAANGTVGSSDPIRTAATTAAVLGRDRPAAALFLLMRVFLVTVPRAGRIGNGGRGAPAVVPAAGR